MSNKEILIKAVGKAIESGWTMWNWEGYRFTNAYGVLTGIQDSEGEVMGVRTKELLFNQKFAKALWGENKEFTYYYEGLAYWCYHLQQMVISDDPIKYLGDYITVDNSL